MICRTEGDVVVALYSNHFKLTRNEKVRSFESRRGPKRSKGKKNKCFFELESLFFFLLIIHYFFPLHFEDDF